MGELEQETEVLVIGSGPGGYAAAFRAADLGMDVTMVDSAPRPGGVCLYKGCIPSKTFLFLSELIYDAQRAESMGIAFDKPRIDLKALREWKGNVIDSMANGLVSLSNRRGVQLIQGRAQFESSNTVRLHDAEVSHIKFRHAIIAAGSHPIAFPGTEFKPGGRIMSSTGALNYTRKNHRGQASKISVIKDSAQIFKNDWTFVLVFLEKQMTEVLEA
jgi:dihydrolipoamide dehydrogenase